MTAATEELSACQISGVLAEAPITVLCEHCTAPLSLPPPSLEQPQSSTVPQTAALRTIQV